MMTAEDPIAVATVYFSDGITGGQLMMLMRPIADSGEPHTKFIAVPRYSDGTAWCVGQAGTNAQNHLRVVPSLEGPSFIRPVATYLWVKVTSYSWLSDDERQNRLSPSPKWVIPAVIEFAEKLQEAYRVALATGFPEYTDPEPVPWKTDK